MEWKNPNVKDEKDGSEIVEFQTMNESSIPSGAVCSHRRSVLPWECCELEGVEGVFVHIDILCTVISPCTLTVMER